MESRERFRETRGGWRLRGITRDIMCVPEGVKESPVMCVQVSMGLKGFQGVPRLLLDAVSLTVTGIPEAFPVFLSAF